MRRGSGPLAAGSATKSPPKSNEAIIFIPSVILYTENGLLKGGPLLEEPLRRVNTEREKVGFGFVPVGLFFSYQGYGWVGIDNGDVYKIFLNICL